MTRSCFTRLHRGLLAAALLATAGGALAQATIDHNKALAGNVTPGDAPGYPITISRAGHYKLMGNLTVPAGSHGIQITAAHVTLDLNGFTISGAGQCTRNASTKVVSCQPIVGRGVTASAPFVHIRNGTVRGFKRGVNVSDASSITDLVVTENQTYGLVLGSAILGDSIAERTRAFVNGGHGILMWDAQLINVVASRNGESGIAGSVTTKSLVINSLASENKSYGIQSATVRGVMLDANGNPSRSLMRSAGGNADNNGVF